MSTGFIQTPKRKSDTSLSITSVSTVPFQDFFFGEVIICLVQHLSESHQGKNIENLPFWISRNYLFGVSLVNFLNVISAFFFAIKLIVFVLIYIMSNIALVFKGQKFFFLSFLGRLGENFLEFHQLLIGLFFPEGKDKQSFYNSPSSPSNHFKLKLIVLNLF